MTIADAPRLVLSPERLAAELRRARAVEEGERVWRRGARLLAVYCGLLYGVGLVIAWGSLHLTGDAAPVAFWGGMLIGNASVLVYCMVMWARDEG
jgi:lipid-A-disaccharide synthase-like uncharacterized protein